MRRRRTARGGQAGVALLMVITTIAILAIVVVEFSSNARTHLNQGVNLRDQARASTLADTSLVMARACLDNQSWGAFASVRQRLDMEKLCNLMLGIFVRGSIDLPIGGLSVELDGIQGVGLSSGEIDAIKMTPEESFIGLAGLHCARPAGRVGGSRGCAEQLKAVEDLRVLLCDPDIAHVFETERPDGQRYTREEIIANLVDWVDPDDKRTSVNPVTGQLEDSLSEGEDSYYARQDERYRVKDEPFDSIEELRLVRGIDDELFEFLKDKVSVHSAGRVNVNSASVEVLAALLRSSINNFRSTETAFCGQEVEGVGGLSGVEAERLYFRTMAQLLVEVRQFKQMTLSSALARPFRNTQEFAQCAQDVPTCWYNAFAGSLMGFQVQGMAPEQAFQQKMMSMHAGNPQVFQLMLAGQQFQIDRQRLQQSARVDSELFRLEASGRVGNMTRKVFAILKQEPQYVRTLYYREE